MENTTLKVKWGREEFEVEVEPGTSVDLFKAQLYALTNVPVDRMKLLGFPGGLLKDTDDLDVKLAKMKKGAKVTLMGTAEGGELQAPAERTVFEEDLSPEEKARLLKEKKVVVLPPGIKNLGNTCYMNSCLQCLCTIQELTESLEGYSGGGGPDAQLTAQLSGVKNMLSNSVNAITPLQFVMALRQRFPRFAEMQNGGYMQQDADECLRGILTVLSNTLESQTGNRIDDLFGFKLQVSLKNIECEEEETTVTEDAQRVLMCHLGTPTEPVNMIHQGVQLSMSEHIEKHSVMLDRNAQYEKTSKISSLPTYLVVQFARFGYKGANEWAGTSANKVKLIRKIAFNRAFDAMDFCTDGLKEQLLVGRRTKKAQDDAELERQRELLKNGGPPAGTDVEMEPAARDVEMPPWAAQEIDTGFYELVGIVSHRGRTADGGHYVGWTRHEKSNDSKKEDTWLCFDDEDVSMVEWKDMVGLSTDLQGGKADTQIAYINIYKKETVKADLGLFNGGAGAAAAASTGTEPAAEGDAAAAPASAAPDDAAAAPASAAPAEDAAAAPAPPPEGPQ